MDADLAKLKSRIRILSDEEVVKILTSDRNQYAKGALDFAMEEAERRGLDINVDPSKNYENKGDLQKKVDLSGIAGWLIIVAIDLIILSLIFLYVIYERISVLGDPSYSSIFIEIPFMPTLLIIEIIRYTVFFSFAIYITIYFFKKDIRFPKMFTIFLITNAIIGILNMFVEINTYGEASNYSGIGGLLRGFGHAAIWIIYMKKSERVKATFVN